MVDLFNLFIISAFFSSFEHGPRVSARIRCVCFVMLCFGLARHFVCVLCGV